MDVGKDGDPYTDCLRDDQNEGDPYKILFFDGSAVYSWNRLHELLISPLHIMKGFKDTVKSYSQGKPGIMYQNILGSDDLLVIAWLVRARVV